jgi:hypothetical protein
MDVDEARKEFPHLTKEIEDKKMRVRIDSIRSDPDLVDKKSLSGFLPDAVDYIRRCETVEEAMQIIDFLEEHKELVLEEAVRLRAQLKAMGIKSFGSKKKPGYYELKKKR